MSQERMFTIDQLKEAIKLAFREMEIDAFLSKPQINRTELYKHYGAERARNWIKHGLLKPASQNGKRSNTYFNHKKVIELSNNSYHYFSKAE